MASLPFLCIQSQPQDDGSCCIGSSHGWLILFKPQAETNNLYLFNPSSGARIQLPTFRPFAFTQKAVLYANPATTNECIVVLIYALVSKTAFLNMVRVGRSDLVSREWRDLDQKYVMDVIIHGGLAYELYRGCDISVWDVRAAVKLRDVRASPFSKMDYGVWESKRHLCLRRWYVVESAEEFVIVSRVMGEFVRDREPIFNPELLDTGTNHPPVCPYRTLSFQVYRLDGVKNEWVEVMSIGANRVMFLGVNQSVCVSTSQVPGCEGNSIYFIDDCRERMDGDHDSGVYRLDDKSVQDLYQPDLLERIEPPAGLDLAGRWLPPPRFLESLKPSSLTEIRILKCHEQRSF